MAPYPPDVVRHLTHPVGAGAMDAPDAVGESGSTSCGDLVTIQLRIVDGRIDEARFLAFGCPAATAAASAACARLNGADLEDAMSLSTAMLDADLGGLDAHRRHGPRLVADAVARALERWFSDRLGEPGLPLSGERVLVAMSGGVDSAVAAMLARASGRRAIGVTMRLWHDPAALAAERSCCSPETVRMARDTAHALGMPHLTIDAADAFRRGVVEDFIAGYTAGRTPNPCVTCNGTVRFAVLSQVAALLGARGLTTGHYARVVRSDRGTPAIARAVDTDKDQSYMLAMVPGETLERLEFPLGELTKPEVREMAGRAELPAADAVESQEICFVGEGGYAPFLERNAGLGDRPGDVVDAAGTVLGSHGGYWRFTIGQRRGIGIASPEPLYVLGTDADSNRVVVGPRQDLATWGLTLHPAVGHDVIDPTRPFEVRVRYRGAALRGASVVPADDETLQVNLDEPADGAAPGQTATIYQDGRLVAAGTIAGSRPRAQE
ncbi:MAG: tRNA 2-thiouridine(34) synthase MnmA [Thermoleophilia bacterium]